MKLLSLFIIALSLSGCFQTKVSSHVIRYHDRNLFDYGKSIAVTLNEKQAKNLEVNQYKNLIEEKLMSYGYKIADTKKSADYALNFKFSHKHEGEDPFMPNMFKPTSFHKQINKHLRQSKVYYKSTLNMSLVDLKTNKPIAESTAKNEGYYNNANIVKNCLITAVFMDFPGHNGSIDTYELEPIDCSIY